ncbi:MAG: hypothetical protein ACKN9T_10940 [Candidatus Methylumidiphilus sp.]
MLMMLGIIISMLSSVLFYRTAAAKGAPAIQWAVVGFGSYFLTNLTWTFMVSQPIAHKLAAQNLNGKAMLVNGSGILLGVVVAWLIWSQLLNKLKAAEE